MEYPTIPTVIPERIISLLCKALAIAGTNGGEKIIAEEEIITVSVSILNTQASTKCKNKDPKMTNITYHSRYTEVLANIAKSAIEPTTTQNTRIRYIPD
jgi:hypothetical protein